MWEQGLHDEMAEVLRGLRALRFASPPDVSDASDSASAAADGDAEGDGGEAPRTPWREKSGRPSGSSGYEFGDITRSLARGGLSQLLKR